MIHEPGRRSTGETLARYAPDARRAAIIVAVWTGVALFTSWNSYLGMRLVGRPMVWADLLLESLASCWIWAAFTPPMLWLARRFRVERRRWAGAALVHLAAGVGFALLDVVVDGLLPRWVDAMPRLPLLTAFTRELWINLFSYVAVVLAGQAAYYYGLSRKRQVRAARLSAQLANAQLAALRGQLQPHFLFNTLNGIAELVHRDPERADLMLTRLAMLLRRSIDTMQRREVSLAEELEFVDAYCDLMRMRLGARLTVVKAVDAEALSATVPALLLQPLVENAIRHGIEPVPAGGRVEIEARRRGDVLVLEVRDDGRGLPEGFRGARGTEGVGLSATRRRLRRLYGKAHGLAIRARPEGGAVAAVTIPWRDGAREVARTAGAGSAAGPAAAPAAAPAAGGPPRTQDTIAARNGHHPSIPGRIP